MRLHDHARELTRRHPKKPHRLLRRRILIAFGVILVVDAIGTVLMWSFERDRAHGAIANLWDAFFFTTVQLLTVSSQMPNPVTTSGRIVDIVLELAAIVLVSSVAGAFASFYLHLSAADGEPAAAPARTRRRRAAGG